MGLAQGSDPLNECTSTTTHDSTTFRSSTQQDSNGFSVKNGYNQLHRRNLSLRDADEGDEPNGASADLREPLLFPQHESTTTVNTSDLDIASDPDQSALDIQTRIIDAFHRFLSEDSLRKIWQVVRPMGDYLAYLTLLVMLIFIPIVIYNALTNRHLDYAAFKSARVMVLGTLVLSCRLVYLHLTHWYMPEVQKYVVRILLMVPIYAIQSWLSLVFRDARIYIDSLRDFYEAFVIASFVYYLMELLGGQDSLVEILSQKDPSLGHHTFPLSLVLEPWELGRHFMLQCKHGVLQYVAFKCVATVVIFVCVSLQVYGEGEFNWFRAYGYLAFFQNMSVMYALYCLVMLYSAVNEELRNPVNWNPLGKFLCVKGVIFFTWWQGVVIFYLRAHGIIGNIGSWSSEDVANGLIDYCIVVEMVGFAIAHSYTFTYKEYLPNNIPSDALDHIATNEAVLNEEPSQQTRRYRPPATLHTPMGFSDAFWSSTVPRETFQDMQRLRAGIRRSLNEPSETHDVSLSRMGNV